MHNKLNKSMAALSYSLAPTFNRASVNNLERDQHHMGLS